MTTTWRRLMRMLLRYRGRFLVALAAMIALAMTTGLYPLLMDLLTTSLFRGPGEVEALLSPRLDRAAEIGALFGLGVDGRSLSAFVEAHLFALFGVVVIFKALSQAIRFFVMGEIAQKVVRDLRNRLFSAVVGQSTAFFSAEASGFLVSRVINDVAQVERAATYAVPVLFGDALKVLVLAGVCLWQYPSLSLVTLVVVPFAAFPIVRFGKMIKRYAGQGQEALGGLTHRVTETLGGIRVVHTHGGEGHEEQRFAAANEAYVRVMLKSTLVRALQTPIMELIGVGALLLTIAWADWQIAQGAIRPGEVIAFLLALILLYEPLKAIGRSGGIVLPGLVAAERVFEMIDRPPTVVEAPGARDVAPMREAVVFEAVRFRYPGAPREAISGLDLVLPRGSVVALVGPSGGGKSTVAALLPRLYDPSAGCIRIDGVDIREMTLASLRGQLAVVGQETYLFNESIHANIAYGRPGATREEIERAARAAFAHDFIVALPQGYDTIPGERGVQLSGGQRQRIAIARAFLRDAPILILDEATSALDNESEREVQRALDALQASRTVLVIAHRLSTIRNADEIVVLDRGEVVERGTHPALSTRGGAYARLLKSAEDPARVEVSA
ncbi:MAG: ABC transporter ATP-binding protein [Deltaproteobacteria bacterium]|nr:ABC transporter ATP-binding protein [Deltaproteobacteria bacterium]